MDDALSQAANAAKGRAEAENAEREKRRAVEQAQQETTNAAVNTMRQPSIEPISTSSQTPRRTRAKFVQLEVADARRRSLRSASIASRENSVERGE